MSDKVLVTGASGFIAGYVIEALKARGYDVRGTVRTRRPEHERLGIELVEADLLDASGWDAAVEGCGLVMHMASPLPTSAPDDEMELIRPAVDGTSHVLKACTAAGVRRVVLTSSSASVVNVDRPPGHVYTGEDFSDPAQCSPYPKSKTLAEKAAWDLVDGFELAVINPTLVVGPLQTDRINSSLEPIYRLMARKVPAVPRLGFNMVDVRDVAEAHCLALETREAAGQRYLLSAGFFWMQDMARMLSEAFPDQRVPTGSLPYPLLWLVGRVDPAVRGILPDIGKQTTMSSDKAREELGWTTRDPRGTVVDCGRSMIERGLV